MNEIRQDALIIGSNFWYLACDLLIAVKFWLKLICEINVYIFNQFPPNLTELLIKSLMVNNLDTQKIHIFKVLKFI